MGEIVDTNTPYLAQELAKAGITVKWSSHVGDDLEDLQDAFTRAFKRADFVVTCGGLGPTSDDLCREAAAEVMGEIPVIDNALLQWLKGVFAKRGITNMPKSNYKQAWLIPSALAIHNELGTAPGWWIEKNSKYLVLTPGPPREIKHMWSHYIAPRLAAMGLQNILAVRTLKTFGMTEGDVDEVLSDLFKVDNPYLGIYARRDGIHLRIIAHGDVQIEVDTLANQMMAKIEARLAGHIWGRDNDTPGSVVAILLRNKNLSLAVAEGTSGGHFASTLKDNLEETDLFKGGLILGGRDSNLLLGPGSLWQLDASEGETGALQMASTARNMLQADIGIGIAERCNSSKVNPADDSVFVAITDGASSRVTRSIFAPGRPNAAERAALFALVELAGWLGKR